MNQDQLQEFLAEARTVLDFESDELRSARALRFVLSQTFAYTYSGPVSGLRQRLLAFPPVFHGDQQRTFLRLSVEPDSEFDWSVDSFGNTVAELLVPSVVQTVRFSVEALIERAPVPRPMILSSESGPDSTFLAPTVLTAPSEALVAAARDAAAGSGGVMETAERICQAVHRNIRYQKGVTAVETTAAEALAIGAGVCQDHAHVMIAMCRVLGIPTRYVSGHMLGEGSTHAWVEVLAAPSNGDPGLVAVPFDPLPRTPTGLKLRHRRGRPRLCRRTTDFRVVHRNRREPSHVQHYARRCGRGLEGQLHHCRCSDRTGLLNSNA